MLRRRAVETGELLAVPIEDEGRRGLDHEAAGKDPLGVYIDPNDLQAAGPFHGEHIDKGFDRAAVPAPFGPEFGKDDLGPIPDLLVIACCRHVDRFSGDLKGGTALSADGMAAELIQRETVQRSAGFAPNDDGIVQHRMSL